MAKLIPKTHFPIAAHIYTDNMVGQLYKATELSFIDLHLILSITCDIVSTKRATSIKRLFYSPLRPKMRIAFHLIILISLFKQRPQFVSMVLF